MADTPTLRATPQRIALMRAIDDGSVERYFPLGMFRPPYDQWDKGPAVEHRRYCTVTGQVGPLSDANLIQLGNAAGYKEPRRWELTDAGRQWLEAHSG